MSNLGEARTESQNIRQQDAKARLAAALVLSHFAPSLIGEPSTDHPYGTDQHGNPKTRQQRAAEEGKHPLQTGMVGSETAGHGVLANITQHQQLRGLMGGMGAPFVPPAPQPPPPPQPQPEPEPE